MFKALELQLNTRLERGTKRYELANHLGNVLTVISDKKTAICTGNTFNYFTAERISATDYSPFGAPLAGRTWNGGEYRFGFNSMEKDNEINGTGNAYDFGARIYDGRLGRFLSIDPLFKRFSNESNFIFAGCSPIAMVDLLGKAKTYYIITIALDGSRKTKIVKEKYEVIKEEIEETQELGLGANNPVFTETRNFDVVQIVIIDERTNTITSKQPFKSKERTSSKVLNDLQDDLEMLQSMESKDGVMWYSKTGQGQETKKGKNAEMENIDLLLDALNSVQSAAGNKGGEIIFKFKDDSKTVIEQMKVTLDGNDLMDKVTNFNALKEFGHFVRGHKYDSCTSCGYVGPCGFKHNEEKIVPAKGDYDAKK